MLSVGADGLTADELHEALGFSGLNETTVYDGYSDIIFSLHVRSCFKIGNGLIKALSYF